VMKLASSESRNRIAAASSSALAVRFCMLAWPNTAAPAVASPSPRASMIGMVMPVSVRPGDTALTRISGATSRLSCVVNPSTAAFAAPYATLVRCARRAATEAMLTIEPPPRARRCGTACLHTRKGPPTCTAIIRFHRSRE
jgi:hypothetical protein